MRNNIKRIAHINPIKPKAPWSATKVHKPPICNQRVKSPCASGPHKSNNEWAILFEGVETAAVKTLQPSRNEEASIG